MMFIFNSFLRLCVLFCLLFPLSLAGRDSTAVGQFSLSYKGNLVTLTIEYKMKDDGLVKEKPKAPVKRDTTGNIFEQFFGSKKDHAAPATAFNNTYGTANLENAIRNKIIENKDVSLEPDYPDYIVEMAALHKSRKKREKALRIYAANNADRLIQSSQSTSATYSEGRFSNTATVTITCRLKLNKKTRLIIPGFTFTESDKKYYSQPLVIDL